MRVALRSLLVCVLGCVAGLSWFAMPVYASEGLESESALPVVGGSLAPSGVEALAGGEGAAEREARRDNPEAVEAREVSDDAYEGLNGESAEALVARTFPELARQTNVPLSSLPSGQKVTGYVGPYTALLSEENGQRALAVSSVPVAIETSPTTWGPVNLGLQDVAGGFVPATPLVAVRAPRTLADGVSLTNLGIAVTPVGEGQESPGGSEGVLDGASVFYANTQTDSDTVVKPTMFGFDVDTILRSSSSPEQISFRFGLPEHASLVAPSHLGGDVLVVKEGVVIASVPAPEAYDAAGTAVPLSVTVAGNILMLTVVHKAGEYLMPINVDPEVYTGSEGLVVGNWHRSEASGGGFTYEESVNLRMSRHAPFPKNDWASWATETKGDSKIYAQSFVDHLEPEEAAGGGSFPVLGAWFEIFKEGVEDTQQVVSGTPYVKEASVCAASGCPETGGAPGNLARFEVTSDESSAEAVAKKEFAKESEAWYGGILTSTLLLLSQPKETHSTVSYNTGWPEIEYTSGGKHIVTPNVMFGSNNWIGPNSGALEFESSDAGLGVAETNLETTGSFDTRNFEAEQNGCIGVQCAPKQHEVVTWSTLAGHVSNGLNKFRANARDAMSGTASSEHGEGEVTLRVDTEPPHNIKMSGLSVKGKVYELGEVEAHLKVEATDGEGSVSSSGVKSLGLEMDGKGFGVAGGSCSPGPCTASNEWAINGAELGAGQHVMTVVATDNAGNISTETFELTVYHASPIAMGPGSVNPESGDFALEASDVDLSGGTGPLIVSRHFDSRNPTEGAEGPLGPQWNISLGSVASLEVLPDGSAMVIGAEGLTFFSLNSSGAFEAPTGDSNLALVHKGSEYILSNKDKGTSTIFTQPSGSSEWMATASTGQVATDTMTDEYETIEIEAGKKIARPKLELAPHPSATCVYTKTEVKWEAPCRALLLGYAETTTAKSETEWGDYKYHLKEILAVTYNSSNVKEPHLTPVAKYEYDSQGRLRVEWDPRISPALKTTYGYDAAGHTTAISPPGQQPYLLTYGTSSGDTSAGRLISMTRPAASTPAGNGLEPINTARPALSVTEPELQISLSVSQGTWSNSPLAYSYQWEDCNASGGECVPIGGADNSSYIPGKRDIGHTLVAQVTASNSVGAVTVTTTASAIVTALDYEREIGGTGEGEGQLKSPEGVATDARCNIWVADTGNNRIEEFSPAGKYITQFGKYGSGEGQFNKPHSLAIDSKGDIYVTDTGNNRIEEFNEERKYIRAFNKIGLLKLNSLVAPTGIAIEKTTGNVAVINGEGEGVVVIFSPPGEFITSFGLRGKILIPGDWFEKPEGLASNGENSIWVTDTGNNQLQTCSHTGCAKFGGEEGSGNGQFNSPTDLAFEANGDAFVVESGNDRVQKLSSGGGYIEQYGSKGTAARKLEAPKGVALDASGDLYVADTKNSRVTKWVVPSSSEPGPPESPNPGTNAVTTIEYGVPVSGANAPAQIGVKDAETWAQSDDPVEATAIFPPDEPMGWPAKEYTRATVYYFDSQARTVNVKSPSGAISTTEDNEDNAVIRSLSAANRATALKETCESKEKCKSAEVSRLLDAEDKYTHEGTELAETTGPQHSVKLATGTEVQARSHTKYFYDEGAPSGEEHGLVTRTVESALVGGKEEEPRTTRTYYSGQKGLGWKLREPTSLVVNPEGLALTHTTVYNETTGSIVETRAPGGTSEMVYPPAYSTVFGSEGSGKGQLVHPVAVALDSAGDEWVDDKGNGRIEKFSPSGGFLAEYGTKGSGNDQFSNAWGIAIAQSTGNVYVTDEGNNRIEELNSAGEFVRVFGTEGAGKLREPVGVTADSSGNVWVTDHGHNRVVEFSAMGTFMQEIGSYGTGNGQLSGPSGIAISEGSLYVVDEGNSRIEQFSLTGAYLNQFGAPGSGAGQFKEPLGIAVNPTSGNLYVSDYGNSRIQEFSPAGRPLAAWLTWGDTHQLSAPVGLAINAAGKLYVTDEYGGEVSEWLPPETGGAHLNYASQFGSIGTGNGQFKEPSSSAIDGQGNIWITDYANSRIQEFSSTGQFIASYGKNGSGNVEFKDPQGIDINQSTGDLYIADSANERIQELSPTGTFIREFGTSGSGQLNWPTGIKIDASGNVWVADTNNNRIVEFSSTGTFIKAYGAKGTGNGEFNAPTDLTFSGANLYVTDRGNHRVQELSAEGKYIAQFGIEGGGSGEFYAPEAITADSAGNLYVLDNGASHIEEFTATGAYLATFATKGNSEGQLSNPTGISINAAGAMIVVDNGNNRIEQWAPADQAVHDTKTIYYTAKGEAEVTACQNHPEWVNLVCQTKPAAQPETSGLPSLPVTTVKTYNTWDEPEIVTEEFGSTTRTKTTSYDAAGRPISNEVTAGIDTPVSAVKDTYDSKLGALAEESNTVEGKTKTIKKTINTLGQLEQYTDADSSVTTYKHDIDGRTTEVAGVIEAGGKKESTYQKYTYEAPSGFLAKLEDSGAGTFKVTRNTAGQITTETYPNAMTATDTYSATGEPISIRYEKTAHCEKTCPETWFKETTVPSAHGETFERANTLTTDTYGYDAIGRLTQVQETPAGKGCVTRLYGYDEESDRTSLTSRAPTSENKCATEGGTTETHKYDPADRLIDNGVSYETFGNTTKLPGADAGGPEMEIKTEYYVDNQVATQTQDGKTYKYLMDPAGRVREAKTETEGKPVLETVTHYAGPGSALAWTNEEEAKKWTQWTRDIPGIDDTLAAIQSSNGKVTLQIHDLRGDIVDTASDLETETKILTGYNSTEFGAPLNGTPPTKYTWLGAAGVSSESSGLITQDGVTYVPQTGRPLQTQGIALPTAENKATAYVSMVSPGIEASAAAASGSVRKFV